MLRGAILLGIFAVLMYVAFDVYIKLGYNVHFHKHHPGQCWHVKGLNFGAEDLDVTSNGQTFITSGLSYPPVSGLFNKFFKANNIQSGIFLYDFKKPNAGAVKLKISQNFDTSTFRPHGLGLLEDKVNGEHLLYVINHVEFRDASGPDRVEKFRFKPKTNELIHLKSFTSGKFVITNDLAVIKEDQFYITNFLYFHNPILSMLEQGFLPYCFGSLVFFNGTHGSEIVPNLLAPNGLMLSKDNRHGIMHVYERRQDNSVSLLQTVSLHTGADNFFLTHSGDVLYAGAHPIGHKVMKHLEDPNKQSPSSVLRIPLKSGKVVEEEITEVFYDHGDLISASSVAATYNNQLIIGSIINKLVICDANFRLS